MNKTLALAGLMAMSSLAAHAEDFTQSVPFELDGDTVNVGSAVFGVTHLQAGAFTDTFTFTGISAGTLTASLLTFGFTPNTDLNFTSVSLNGIDFTVGASGALELVSGGPHVVTTGPLTLTVKGIAGPMLSAGSAITASYAGSVNVSPVPEPATYALMLSGIGVIGMLSRRRLNR